MPVMARPRPPKTQPSEAQQQLALVPAGRALTLGAELVVRTLGGVLPEDATGVVPSPLVPAAPARAGAGSPQRRYTDATLARLWGMSAGFCARLDCKEPVLLLGQPEGFSEGVVIGDRAHIHAISDDGPDADATLSAEDRNAYPNLLMLCPTHHRQIDKLPMADRAATLRRWKLERETWVSTMTQRRMGNLAFDELKHVLNYLADSGEEPQPPTDDPTQTVPKLRKNDLGVAVRRMIMMGDIREGEVRKFVEAQGSLNPRWVARLRGGFQSEYAALRGAGLRGDPLWYALLHFATGRSGLLEDFAPALAIMAYLFHLCEIFEP